MPDSESDTVFFFFVQYNAVIYWGDRKSMGIRFGISDGYDIGARQFVATSESYGPVIFYDLPYRKAVIIELQ